MNIGSSNRSEIAQAILNISSCKPKVIGINVLFEDFRANASDTSLSEAILKSGNAILVTNIIKGTLYKSNIFFSRSSLGEGLMYFGFKDKVVDRHKIFVSHRNDLLWSFPATVASYFDSRIAGSLMEKTLGNEFYRIRHQYDLEDFNVLKANETSGFDCSMINGRIVLFGYLGPRDEDVYLINGSDGAYGTVILANCLENILAGYFVKAE